MIRVSVLDRVLNHLRVSAPARAVQIATALGLDLPDVEYALQALRRNGKALSGKTKHPTWSPVVQAAKPTQVASELVDLRPCVHARLGAKPCPSCAEYWAQHRATPVLGLTAVDVRVSNIINRYCSCGGRGQDDAEACVACRIWHELWPVILDEPMP